MFDLTYQDLTFITVTNVTTTGDAETLARDVQRWDRESEPIDFCDWPTFEDGNAAGDFTATLDVGEVFGHEGTVTWTCRIDLSTLDWGHPWEDRTILAAEALYCEHRDPADPRWTLPHIASDALRWLWKTSADFEGFTPLDADKLMRWYLYDAMPQEAEDHADPMTELLAEAMEDAKPISTGIPRLDVALGGGFHKGLSVIAGDPSSGKTTLAVQAALFAANQQEGTVGYDMGDMGGKKSALLRMISCSAAVCGVEGCELSRAAEWTPRELYEGRRAFDRVTKRRLVLLDKTEVTEVLSQLDYHARMDSVAFAVLDFAQAMTHEGRSLAFDAEATSLAVRELRTWAHAHDAVVVLLSAYSKSASEGHARGSKPTMNDVLGSAELAYSAESVLAISNPHDGKGTVTVSDLKHRHGGGSCTLHLDAQHGLFA